VTGNGTQKAFWDDPSILYISVHLFLNGSFYPGGPDGALDQVGSGAAAGTNVNIPWEAELMGNADYLYAFQKIVMPIAYEFAPDLIIGKCCPTFATGLTECYSFGRLRCGSRRPVGLL
jgi:histone deacetylase 6